ncbi:MAG: PilN domain-containing protein [Candidatus Eremiobacterota bacterium]
MTIKINLYNERPRRWMPDALTVLLLVVVLLGNAGMLAYGQVLRGRVESTRADNEKVTAEIKSLESQLPVLAEREERVRKLTQQLNAIRSLAHDALRYANLLTCLAGALPDDVWLDNLSIDPRRTSVQLRGQVLGPLPLKTLAGLVESLRATGVYRDVEIQSATRSKDDLFTFDLQARYDPQKAAQGGLNP